MEIIRNLARRKLRSILTISGIVIGVLALVTMGAMAEKFNALVAGGAQYLGSNVQVADNSSSAAAAGFGGGGLLPIEKVAALKTLDGVAAAFPVVSLRAGSTNGFGVPDFIASQNPGENNYATFKLTLAQGRDINPASSSEVTLGADFATELKKHVGDHVNLPIRPKDAPPDFVSHPFTVVGIFAKTQTAPDSGAYVSVKAAQAMLKESLPASIRASIDTTKLVSGVRVYGTTGTNLDRLADLINAQVPGVRATKPSELVASFSSGSLIFTAITTGAALIALIVGGLSVINTMLMAVSERVREIGLKKAVGAHVIDIVREYMVEAATIGGLGGAIGLSLGGVLTNLINAATAGANLTLFLLTWRLVIVALLFSIGLGAVAGIVPALRASRMDPVRALRAA